LRGCATFRSAKSTRRLAPKKGAVFQGFVTCLPSPPTRRRSFTLDIAPFPSDWRLPLAAAANNRLEPLPPSQHIVAHRVLAASADAQSHLLHSADRSTSSRATLGGWHTIQSGFGLAIRLTVGGHHPRLYHGTCPRFPTVLPRKLLGSDATPASHSPAITLSSDRKLAISA